MRATMYDIIAFGPRQGGSTITQQLARNVYLTRSKTIARKLAEVILALQLERAYTKPEILELYLNQIYFGEGAYGVEVAAKTYFGKNVWDLNLAECALLAGLPKRPEYYSPFKNEQRGVERRNLVLAMMEEQGYVKPQDAARAQTEGLKLVEERKPLGLANYRAPYFTNYILREVAARYGPDALYRGGFTIYTTLNLEMQQAAEEAVAWGMKQARARRYNVDQMALVALDARTGAIKAMVGGVDYSESQYNRAVQGGRQAGSAFKPYVYTAAMEQGYAPDSIVEDSPVSYPGEPGKMWTPRNYDGKFHGKVTFREALAKSYNVAAVKVADMVGVGSVIATAERMGIYHQMDNYLPLAIGYCDVSPLEMASAYAVFATRGMRTEPFGIRKIEDAQGRRLEEHRVVSWRVLNEQVVDEMLDMLGTVVRSGTAAGIRGMLSFPAAGKTGTSNDFKDAWFIGFTDDLCAATWMGNDAFEPTGPHGRGKGVAGATIPAPVWGRFMVKAQPIMAAARAEEEPQRVIEISPSEQGSPEAPEPPEAPPEAERGPAEGEGSPSANIVTKLICPVSGLLAGPYCPKAVQVTYDLKAGGRPPERKCDVHAAPAEGELAEPAEPAPVEPPTEPETRRRQITLPICAISGKLATARCPIVVNRTFDADAAPTESCDRHGRGIPGP
jgi:penicillin-binding protein 1A